MEACSRTGVVLEGGVPEQEIGLGCSVELLLMVDDDLS